MKTFVTGGITVVALVAAVIFSLLLIHGDKGIEITFDNRTDEAVCVAMTRFERGMGPSKSDCAEGVNPRNKITHSTLCEPDHTIWVVLWIRSEEVYARAATCRDWKDSGAIVSIERMDGALMISDSLLDDSNTPQ